MKTASSFTSVVALAVMTCAAHGADVVALGFRPIESRIFQREALRTSTGLRPQSLASVAPDAEVKWASTLGAAYTDAENGTHTWSTPFRIDASAGAMSYTLQGDGYVRPSGGATGLADPTLLVRRNWAMEGGKTTLVGGGGVTFPVGGPVGGRKFSERVLAGVVQSLSDRWTGIVIGSLLRAEGAQANGRAAYLQVGVAQLQYAFDDATAGILQFVTVHRNGGGTSNQVTAELDFALGEKFTGALMVTRGLTRGARDTTIEFDLSRPF
jgi:hypothetical protein